MELVGFDLDGCLYDFITPAYRELVNHHGVTKEFYEFWVNDGLSKEFWANFLAIESLYSRSKALPQDVDTINKISKRFPIFYLTNRPKNCALVTRQWLRREGFPHYENLYLVQGSKRKMIETLKPKYYLEDRVSNAKDLKGLTTIILKKQFYNKELWNDGFITVDTIPQLLEVIK